MGTTYYCDPDATNATNDGSTWDDAWLTLQDAIDGTNSTPPAGGDIVYCRLKTSASESLSVTVNWNGTSGTSSGGRVRYVGCNSSGTVDGTRYVMDWGANTVDGWTFAGMDFISIENFELKSSAAGSSYDGIDTSSISSDCVFQNIYIHDFPGRGVNDYNHIQEAIWIKCRFSNNGSDGYYFAGQDSHFYGCIFDNNGSEGYITSYSAVALVNCMIYENTADGIENGSGVMHIINCVIADNGANGITITGSGPSYVVGCRITNNSGWGISNTSSAGLLNVFGCYLDNNSSGALNTSGYQQEIDLDGDTAWIVSDGSDSDYGYEGSSGDDYRVASSATLRRKELDIDGTNKVYVTGGCIPTDSGGGGSQTGGSGGPPFGMGWPRR